MQVLIVNQAEVADLLPMDGCMEAMAEVLKATARGEAILPLRPIMWLPERRGALGMMPSYLANPPTIGLKVITVFPGNEGTPYDAHQGAVMLFEPEHGSLQAIMDATEITAIRTAAVSGVATQLLAREDAGDLAILGSGVQARTHLEAMLEARAIHRIRVWSRNTMNALRFANQEASRHGYAIEVCDSAEKAVSGANIICTTTSSREPVLKGEWVAPGAHINAVGSSTPTAREVDTAAMLHARLFVDRRESALSEAGDFIIPKQEGAIGDEHIQAEIGEILLGKAAGRSSPAEITLFKSLGLAVEDAAAARYIYEQAIRDGVGTLIELGGGRT
jgi:ornithine cyclodeaminase/alanine dehydrogenase-like protein (mu-crystallin family)